MKCFACDVECLGYTFQVSCQQLFSGQNIGCIDIKWASDPITEQLVRAVAQHVLQLQKTIKEQVKIMMSSSKIPEIASWCAKNQPEGISA